MPLNSKKKKKHIIELLRYFNFLLDKNLLRRYLKIRNKLNKYYRNLTTIIISIMPVVLVVSCQKQKENYEYISTGLDKNSKVEYTFNINFKDIKTKAKWLSESSIIMKSDKYMAILNNVVKEKNQSQNLLVLV